MVKPRLLLYPDHNLNSSQVKVQRTLNWVLSQETDSVATGSGQTTPVEQLPVPVGHQSRQPSGSDGNSVQSGLMGLRLASSDFGSKPENKGVLANKEDCQEKMGETANPLDTSLPPSSANLHCLVAPKSFTVPTISLTSALDSVWAEKGVGAVDSFDSMWAEKGVDNGLGLGGLISRVSKSSDVLDRLEGAERWWGAWETSHSW